ncbi:MAG: hypothetical protein JSV24_08225 [Bacteroidales bacterium]|nr:MAG: hypothetical protein JSV24_08225 [Bacteroidales bacterium]
MKTYRSSLRQLFIVSLLFPVTNLIFGQSGLSPSSAPGELFHAFRYRNVGPTRGGRVTAVEGIMTQPGTFYMGSTGGGVWKTTDYGIRWMNVSDGFFKSPSIGAIAVVQSDPDIVYVGTGSDGLRSNIITGKGVYKSTDGGTTWKYTGLDKVGQIGAVEIHPDDPETVFVAAIGQAFQPNMERGVYRTMNGGESWELILFVADSIGAVDLEFAPGNPEIIYAAFWRTERKPWTIISGGYKAGGIYKSTDGGTRWKKMTRGLPKGLIGKIDLAVSPSDPDRLYALVEAPPGEGGLYRSDNRGNSFYLVSVHKGLIDRPFYYCNIEANPGNANSIYSLAVNYYHSIDGGISWESIRAPHGDHHDIWINPEDTLICIQSNDGGANISLDGGKTWSSQNNQPTSELYQVEVDDQYPYWLYAGQQDNTSIAVPSLPPYPAPAGATSYWLSVGGCETGPAVPKPGNPDIVYSNCKGRFGVYDKRTGQEQQYYIGATNIYSHNPKDLKYRFQRVAPIHVSPHNSDLIYQASQYLHKTTDNGQTWETISPDLTAFEPDKQVISGSPITRDITGEEYYSAIYSVRESPLHEGLIWVGANDGPVHITRDGGKNWEKVTPPGLPPGGRVDCVEPSPHREGKAYIAVLRYQLGDWSPYIYKTENYGKEWTLLTTGNNGIPADYPTRVVREDPDREGLLYAGTEFGLFISFNDGASWIDFQQNLPVTPVTDIKIFRKDLILSTMGRSFWIMDDLSALHQLNDLQDAGKSFLFKPRNTIRFRYRGTGGNNIPSYPNPSVIIDYYLAPETEGEISLEILNQDGRVIGEFTTHMDTTGGGSESGSDIQSGFSSRIASPLPPSKPGINRFYWNMQHKGAWDKDAGSSYRNGPLVAPGKYEIRLKINREQVYSRFFDLLMDPRLRETDIKPEDLITQEKLALQVTELQSECKLLAYRIEQRRTEITNLTGGRNKQDLNSKDSQLEQMEKLLVTAEGSYMKPMLIDQIRYLASMIDRADQRPGKDAYERFEELRKQVEYVSTLFNELE